jgi:hypothetical protein
LVRHQLWGEQTDFGGWILSPEAPKPSAPLSHRQQGRTPRQARRASDPECRSAQPDANTLAWRNALRPALITDAARDDCRIGLLEVSRILGALPLPLVPRFAFRRVRYDGVAVYAYKPG